MKRLKRFHSFNEEFKDRTLSINNNTYNSFYTKYMSSDNPSRSSAVAWTEEGSQLGNYKMVSNLINQNESLLDYGCGIGDFAGYLDKSDIKISKYLGVDINPSFIDDAKKTYPNHDFELIKNLNDLHGEWDTICAIGVFTWYISKSEFLTTIKRLYKMANKQVVLTLLKGHNPYDDEGYLSTIKRDIYWNGRYKKFSEKLFKSLFPHYNMSFHTERGTLLVRIIK